MIINIDKAAGFCPGVHRAIKKAEDELEGRDLLYAYGSLLHNEQEMRRLEGVGLKLVAKDDLEKLKNETLLIRAHGEPPETFRKAEEIGINIIDATCAVVRRLQKKVESAAMEMEKVNGQVVIYGKAGHPELIGLLGNTRNLGIHISSAEDFDRIDVSRPIRLFSQTTMDESDFNKISDELKAVMNDKSTNGFLSYKTICRHVLNRVPFLMKFASGHELIIFVSGKESSNGKKLFKSCLEVNPKTYMISMVEELDPKWFVGVSKVGISGAASTPQWLMEDVANKIMEIC